MRNWLLAGLLVCLAGLVSSPIEASTIFRWEGAGGTVYFTDDADQIPPRFADSAQEVQLLPLAEYERLTIVPGGVVEHERARLSDRLEHLRLVNASYVESPITGAAGCGPVTLRSERRQVGDRNKRFYVVENGCGVLFDSTLYPAFEVGR